MLKEHDYVEGKSGALYKVTCLNDKGITLKGVEYDTREFQITWEMYHNATFQKTERRPQNFENGRGQRIVNQVSLIKARKKSIDRDDN